MDPVITLDYGSGGKKTASLIEEIILPAFDNPALAPLGDGAVLKGADKIVCSTDSFVVSPLFFPGGDIGKLAVCGSVNDVLMCGGEPRYLSLALIIEEGLETDALRRVVESIRDAAAAAGVSIVTGDTKVVEKGRGDGLYINTTGIGFLRHEGLGAEKMREGDCVICTGTLGDHGTAVMLARGGMLEGRIESDCTCLNSVVNAVFVNENEVRIIRDPTRGGAATTLCEFVEGTSLGIELSEDDIPVRSDVAAACDLLGLDPMYCANEGKALAVVSEKTVNDVIEALHWSGEGKNCAVIGRVTAAHPGRVVMKTRFGGTRVLQKLAGAQLPRIC